MWIYNEISREQFEEKKDFVERIILKLGGEIADVVLPYEQKETAIFSGFSETHHSIRPVFIFENEYYRVGEVLFDKPYIVIEAGNYNDLINNTMEDAEPFPYDLPDGEVVSEVKYSLGIEPYPKGYPENSTLGVV